MLFAALATSFAVLAPCAPQARPRIAEVFYDAVGDDTGHEFVELFNSSAAPYPLAGVRLEAGDGAGPGRWTLRWVGEASDSIAGNGRFLIGGALLTPIPEAVVQLDLQNGPDAVRVVWPDGAIEVLGYGAVSLAEHACGAPAPDAPSGFSLARTPDDADLGSNALDFAVATPSPGISNRPGRDAAIVAGTLAIEPAQPGPDRPSRLTGVAANRGAEAIAGSELAIEVAEAGSDAPPLGTAFVELPIAAGDTARFGVPLPELPAGKRVLRARARLAGDASSANDDDSLRVRVGPGPLEVTEIQFHPANGEGEWIEVRHRGEAPLALADFTVSDRRGAPGVPAGGVDPLAPGSLAVLAQDRAALLARFPAVDAARVWEVRPWGSLNNGDDSTGTADLVIVRESDGTPCEAVSYTAAGVPAGVPIERGADGAWFAAVDPLGGPLLPPRALPPLPARFVVSPRRLGAPGVAVARIGWDLPWPRGRIAVDLFDLSGRRVAQVLAETAVTSRGERSWSAAGLSPGVYVLALQARAEGGGGSLTATQPLRIEGGAR